MARPTYEDAKSFVVNLLSSSGGELTRIELDKKLNDANVGEHIGYLKQLYDQGVVKKRVVAVPDGKPVLYYYLPELVNPPVKRAKKEGE